MSASKEFQVIGQFITNVVDKPYTFFNPDKKIEDNALQIAKHFYDKGIQKAILKKILLSMMIA
jgi:U3 small nucleolar RNA-associated protein MPP10